MLFALLILLMPSTIGVATVIVLTGCALIASGAIMIAVSLRLRKIHNYFHYKDVE